MAILSEAFAAVHRNRSALLIFLAIVVGASGLVRAGDYLVTHGEKPETPSAAARAYSFATDLLLAFAGAIAQAVAFSRMGREIDWPLWRVADDKEALKRFFVPWFVLNLALFTLGSVIMRAPMGGDEKLRGALFMWLLIPAATLCIPLGSCVMFHGRFEWRLLGESLGPLARQVPRTLLILMFNFLQILVMVFVQIQLIEDEWAMPLADVLGGYFDCVVFAAVWLLCMHDRDTVEDSDLDF